MSVNPRSLNEQEVRRAARATLHLDKFLCVDRCRRLEVAVRARTTSSRRARWKLPPSVPEPSEYVRWVCEEGYLDPFAYLYTDWVWRPIIREMLAGQERATKLANLFVFDRQTAEQLDDLEEGVLHTVRRTRSAFSVEVVAPHAAGLSVVCGRIRWRAYDHRRRSLQTVYLDVSERGTLSNISIVLPDPIACPSIQSTVHAPEHASRAELAFEAKRVHRMQGGGAIDASPAVVQ